MDKYDFREENDYLEKQKEHYHLSKRITIDKVLNQLSHEGLLFVGSMA